MHVHLLVNRIQPFARTSMMCAACIGLRVRSDFHLPCFFLKGAGAHASFANIEVRTLRGYVVRSCLVASNACNATVSSQKTFAFFVSFEGCRFTTCNYLGCVALLSPCGLLIVMCCMFLRNGPNAVFGIFSTCCDASIEVRALCRHVVRSCLFASNPCNANSEHTDTVFVVCLFRRLPPRDLKPRWICCVAFCVLHSKCRMDLFSS